MDKEEIIRRLKKISRHAVHVVGEPPFIMSLDDGIALDEAVRLLKEREPAKGEKPIRYGLVFWKCNACSMIITEGDKFCRECGKAVKCK